MPTLEWIGKDKVVNHHQEVPYRVLERQYSYDEAGQHAEDNGSENMIIHGDNLEALKALLPRYEGKVKCIYIDPPYNTAKSTNKGQQWVYNDNVDHPKIKEWIGKFVGDVDTDFSRHDKWLCMMYPRLKLLQKLLAPNGVIFISIDDNEYSNLKAICDEIFGQQNYVKTFIWYTEGHTDNQDDITGVHEYILCFSKNKMNLIYNAVVDPNTPRDSKILRDFAENSITKNGYKNPASDIVLPIGFPCEVEELFMDKSENITPFTTDVEQVGYITREMTKKYSMKYPARKSEMVVKNYVLVKECIVYSGWMNAEKLRRFIENDCEPIVDGNTLLRFYLSRNGVIYYYRSGRQSHYIQTVLENMGTTETNKYMIEKMGLKFDYPKPVELIRYLLSVFTAPGDIILDSFAGSGTTAQATLTLGNPKSLENKFILVEMEDYAEPITAKRVKKVISGYEDVRGTGGNFSYYELGPVLLLPDGNLNEEVGPQKIREYVYYMETKEPLSAEHPTDEPYFMGLCRNTAYYFYYERESVTTLDHAFLATIQTKAEGYTIYADLCAIPQETLRKHNITFKKIPRDIARL